MGPFADDHTSFKNSKVSTLLLVSFLIRMKCNILVKKLTIIQIDVCPFILGNEVIKSIGIESQGTCGSFKG
jgi:hypothetical protein